MGVISIRLNVNDANKILNGLNADLPDAVTLAITRVALYFRDNCVLMAQAGHPDHPNVISGRLAGSMRYKMLSTGVNASAEVGSDVEYAPWVELGHMSPNWGDPSKGWHVVPAYPWFQPAISQTFDSGDAQQIYSNSVREGLGQ